MTQTLENLDEFERLLEESFAKSYSVADIVEGTVMKKENDGWLISVKGAKTEAFLPEKEIPAARAPHHQSDGRRTRHSHPRVGRAGARAAGRRGIDGRRGTDCLQRQRP